MLRLIATFAAVGVSGCATAADPATISEADVVAGCRAAGSQWLSHPQVRIQAPTIKLEADGGAPITCTIDTQNRTVISATVGGVERITRPHAL